VPTINQKEIVSDHVQIPVELCKHDSDWFVVSLSLPRGYFKDPFFIDSLAKSFNILKAEIRLPEEDELLARPVHYDETDKRVVYIQIDEFIKRYSGMKIDKKLGFIFHMSRCGSTLATQMLAVNDRFFVLSEPTIINAVLDPALEIDQEKRSFLLRAVIQSLVTCSPEMCEQVFVKFRSWNILYLDKILKCFPNVAWMFIHRQGLEVLQSVLEKPPGWLRSRKSYTKYFASWVLANENDIQIMTDDEYATRILGAFCRVASGTSSKNKIFVDYVNLKKDFVFNLSRLWGINFNDTEIEDMITTSKLYSKDVNKKEKFQSDSEEKRSKATKIQDELANKFTESERLKLVNSQYEN